MLKKSFEVFGFVAVAALWAFIWFCVLMGEAWCAALRDRILAAIGF